MKKSLLLCLSLGIAGAANAQWTGTNPLTTTSKVGIGTSSPIGKLEIQNTNINDPCLRIVRAINLSSISTNTIEVLDGTAATYKLLWLNNAGRLGIGSLSGSGERDVLADANGLLTTQNRALSEYGANLFSSRGHIDMSNYTIHNASRIMTKSLNVGAPGDIKQSISGSGFNNIIIESAVGIQRDPDGNNYKLDVNGNVRCVSLLQTSDKRFKKDFNDLNAAADKIYKVKAYRYKFHDESGKYAFDDKEHFGFIAQELEKEFPNLVNKDYEGNYAVNYIEFIPLLLDAVQKQKDIINEQESRLAALEEKVKAMSMPLSNNSTVSTKFQGSYLQQNTPNPFSTETIIRFNISDKFNNAFIGIYDLNGKQVKRIPIQTSEMQITVPAHVLSPGTFIYNLVVDGQIIDSKKMVVID